jgi:nucleoside-diphosphate-sugar epimerase
MTETVLVTGGSGFVAGWVIVELLRRGYAVRATVRDVAKGEAVRAAVGSEVDPGDRLTFAAVDLMADAGWDQAMAGCAFVQHIASPLGNDDTVIDAAVQGTERVLNAAKAAGVKRVVLTSSMAACTPVPSPRRAITEADWTDPDQPDLSVYRKSKVLAEKAAWEAMKGSATELVTILPGAIFGPVLSAGPVGSVGIIQRLLKGGPPAMPRLAFNIIDVRDLAAAHVVAMTTPAAASRRFIVVGEPLWFSDMADALRAGLGADAAKVPKAKMPDVVFKGIAAVQPEMKALLPLLGRTTVFSSQAARDTLGFAPRPGAQTVVDSGAALITHGLAG